MVSSQHDKPAKGLHYMQEALPREELMSSPLASASESVDGGKPKRKPTVTPRTFTRFFTPRSSLEKRFRSTSSRQALQDITTPAINRNARLNTPTSQKLEPFADVKASERENGWSGRLVGTKRKRFASPDSTVGGSSPLKKKRTRGDTPIITGDFTSDGCSQITGTEDEVGHEEFKSKSNGDLGNVGPIRRRMWSGTSGRLLERSLSSSVSSMTLGRVDHCGDRQTETASFFSRPEDTHLCTNADQDRALPFCVASCNTNPLVAIGDEDGGIRLLESAKNGKPEFSTAYLTFQPHKNAILDLTFSSDDMLLATASGDQSAKIIDMSTQQTTFTMAGHVSSVKQVRFQPGSNDQVIATSSRDGSVQIWDLRCKVFDGPVRDLHVSLDPSSAGSTANKDVVLRPMAWARSVNSIIEAHAFKEPVHTIVMPMTMNMAGVATDTPSKTKSPGRRGDISVTALAFLQSGREHLLLTASEANTSVKLWDLRTTLNHRRGRARPLSTTCQPQSHDRHRQFGLTSLSLSGDGARFYTLCRDNTVYAFATSHLILGHAPELSSTLSRPRRAGGLEREGLGPIYGFRHPRFLATTFYVKSSLRRAFDDKSEMLSVGSSDGCAVLFPTDERFMKRQQSIAGGNATGKSTEMLARSSRTNRPPLSRTSSSVRMSTRLEDTIPIYQHGTALVRGHSKEVTASAWTYDGDLITVGDDFAARYWREGADARDLRLGGEKEGRRWGCGWAEVEGEWDEDD